MSAIGMAMMLDRTGALGDQSSVVSDLDETEEKKVSTSIRRERDSIDFRQARDLALVNFNAECPEQQQGQGQRLS